MVKRKPNKKRVLKRKIVSIKRPTQHDAEMLASWANAMNEVFLGGASDKLRRSFRIADKHRIANWNRIFGDRSPWIVKRNNRGKLIVAWDKFKAKRLKI